MIVQTPEDDKRNNSLICVLCGRPTTFPDATVGLLYGNGQQAFAHAAHMQGRTEWFVGWAMFIAVERRKLLDQGTLPFYTDESEWK